MQEKIFYNHILAKRGYPQPSAHAAEPYPNFLCGTTRVFLLPQGLWNKSSLSPLAEDVQERHVIFTAPKFSFKAGAFEWGDKYVETFTEQFCSIDRTVSRLAARYSILAEDEVSALEAKHCVNRTKFPGMLATDATARVYGFKPGQFLKILKHGEYRYVYSK